MITGEYSEMLLALTFCLFLGFLFPKSKRCFYLVTMAAGCLLGGYNGEMDLFFYRQEFLTGYVHPGFNQKIISLLFIIFHKLGMSFGLFHFAYTFLAIFLIAIFIRKLTDSPAYVMSIMCTFAFLESGWQMKFLGMMTIVTYALYYYYRRIYRCEIKIRNIMTYAFLIFIAMQFHYMAVFFYLFLLAGKFEYKSLLVGIVFFDLILIALLNPAMRFAVSYLKFSTLAIYIEPMSVFSTAVTIIWQLVCTALVLNSYSICENRKFAAFVRYGTILLLACIPMYRYTTVATRFFRVWMIFIAAYFSHLCRNRLSVSFQRFWFDLYNGGSFAYWFALIMVYNGTSPLIFELYANNVFGTN